MVPAAAWNWRKDAIDVVEWSAWSKLSSRFAYVILISESALVRLMILLPWPSTKSGTPLLSRLRAHAGR